MLQRFNDDIIFYVFSYLNVPDTFSLSRTSWRFYSFVSGNRSTTVCKDLVRRYSYVRDLYEFEPSLNVHDLDSWSTDRLKQAVTRLFFFHSNLQKERPQSRLECFRKGSSWDLLRVWDYPILLGKYLVQIHTDDGGEWRKVFIIDLTHEEVDTLRLRVDASTFVRRGAYFDASTNSTFLLFWKELEPEENENLSLVVRKVNEGDGSKVSEDNSDGSEDGSDDSEEDRISLKKVFTSEIPFHPRYASPLIIAFTIDSSRKTIALAFPLRRRPLNEGSILDWYWEIENDDDIREQLQEEQNQECSIGLIVVLDWDTNRGLIIDTELPFKSTACTKVTLTEGDQNLLLWTVSSEFIFSKSYKISRLEELSDTVVLNSFAEPITDPAEQSSAEYNRCRPCNEKVEKVIPYTDILPSQSHFSGPLYGDSLGEISCFSLYETISTSRKDIWVATHFYATGTCRSSNFFTFDIEDPATDDDERPIVAVDSHHLCWIGLVKGEDIDEINYKLYLISFAEAHSQGSKYLPRIIDLPEEHNDHFQHIWLRMDLAAIVVQEYGHNLIWIRLA